MKKRSNIYRDVGCSQEDHLPNCSHFGMTGKYLSEHSVQCKRKTKGGVNAPCICNPTARAKAKKVFAKEYDEEREHEMDRDYEMDGW